MSDISFEELLGIEIVTLLNHYSILGTTGKAVWRGKYGILSKMDAEAKRVWRWISIILAFCAVLAAYLYFSNLPPPNGKYDAFARCIADTSTTFYGAWWCPHCQAQKTEFGDAAKYLPYVECSDPDGAEKQSCVSIGITSYPTWYFPDGSSSTGDQPLANLSKETGCALPTST